MLSSPNKLSQRKLSITTFPVLSPSTQATVVGIGSRDREKDAVVGSVGHQAVRQNSGIVHARGKKQNKTKQKRFGKHGAIPFISGCCVPSELGILEVGMFLFGLIAASCNCLWRVMSNLGAQFPALCPSSSLAVR